MARKARFEDYPNVRLLKGDKLVFRHPLVGQKALPGEVGSEEFVAAYEALRLLVEAPAKKVERKLPTFQDAYDEFTRTDEWREFTMNTLRSYKTNSTAFLQAKIPGSQRTFGEAEIGTPEAEILPLLRQFVNGCKPHKCKKIVEVIRKIYATAIDQNWVLRNLGNDIERKKLPKVKPQKKWPIEVSEQFERHHPLGSRARTCYALARYLGTRCGDVAAVRWDQLRPHRYVDATGNVRVVTMIEFWTSKGKKRGSNSFVSLIVRPELEEVLNALDRSKGGAILKSSRGEAYSEDSLSHRMEVWCEEAGIEPGYTLHGLRRTFATELATGKADLFTIQKAMGHMKPNTTIQYLNELDTEPFAEAAIEAVERRTAQIKRLREVEK